MIRDRPARPPSPAAPPSSAKPSATAGPDDPLEAAEAAPSLAKRKRRHWLGLGVALLIMLALALWLDLSKVAQSLAGLHPAALVGIVLLLALDRVLMAWKWLLLLRAGDVRLSLRDAVRFYFQGTLAGTFMPSMVGGDVLRGYWAARASGATHLVFASLVMEKMLGFLSAILWGIAGLVVFAWLRFPETVGPWPALGLAAAAGIVALFVLSLHARTHAFVLRALVRLRGPEGRTGLGGRLFGLAHKLYDAYTRFATARSVLARNFALTLAEHFLQMLILMAIAGALGITLSPLLFLAVSAAHLLILRIPISPEGWGVGELSAIALYGLIGIDAEAAFAIMFVCHVLVLVACLSGVLLLLPSFPARAGRKVHTPPHAARPGRPARPRGGGGAASP